MENAESGKLPPVEMIDGASDTPELVDDVVDDRCGIGNCRPTPKVGPLVGIREGGCEVTVSSSDLR